MKGEIEFRQKLSQLQAAIITKEAQINSNPLPYLKEMESRCCELLEVFEDIERALSPDMIFDFWESSCNKKEIPRPMDIQGEAYIRCNKALEIIGEFKSVK